MSSVSSLHRIKSRVSHTFDYLIEVSPRFAGFFSLFMIATFMERFYSRGSGSFNSVITLSFILIFCAIIALHLRRLRFDLYDLVAWACIAYFALHSFDSRSIFYAAKLFIIYSTTKTLFKDLSFLHRTLVILGFVCCLIFCRGTQRWSGFYSASAPVFGLAMTCTVLYLLGKHNSTKFDVALAGIATFLVAMTRTRILLLASLVLWLARFGNKVFSRIVSFLGRHKFLAVVCIAAVVLFVATYYEDILDLVGRDDGHDSNRTRMQLMLGVFGQWIASPQAFLFGNGGGYAMAYTAFANSGFVGNLPVHQDVLMLLCDYGIFGVSLFALALCPMARKWPWYCWVVFAVATFHNVFTTSSACVLMFLTFQTLAFNFSNQYLSVSLEASQNAAHSCFEQDTLVNERGLTT